jgi:tetratricopeptide (TPR) repeat protein
MRSAGLLCAEGLEALLDIARSLIRDDPAVGQQLAELVRDTSELAGAPFALPRATYLLAQASAASGDMATSLSLIEDARSGFETVGLAGEALRTNLGRAMALNEMGRHDEALAACREILTELGDVSAADPSAAGLVAAAHQNSGLCFELTGRFEDALDHYASATIGYEALGDSRAVAEVTYDRALVLLTLGQHAEALSSLQRSAVAFHEGGFRALEVMALAHTAEVQLHRGEYQQCLRSLAEASAALEGISSPGGEQTRLLVAGRAYLALNLLPESLAAFSEALAQLTDSDLVIERAHAKWGQGLALARTGRTRAAADALRGAAEQFASSGQSSWLAEVLVDEARLLHMCDDVAGARSTAAAARIAAVDGTPAAASAELLIAELAEGEGALEAVAGARRSIEMLGLAPLTASAAHLHGRGLLRAGRLDEALSALGTAVDIVESMRGSIANEFVLTRFLDDKLSPYEDLLAVMVARRSKPESCLRVADQAKSRTLSDVVRGLVARDVHTSPDDQYDTDLRALYGELFSSDSSIDRERSERLRGRVIELETGRDLARLHSLPADGSANPEATQTVAAELAAGTIVISYARAGDDLHAFVVHDGEVELLPTVASLRAVTGMVDRLRRQWDRFRLGPDLVGRHLAQLEGSTRAVLADLHRSLFQPLEPILRGLAATNLVIIPDSALHDVPFQALWDGSGWLLERYEVRYAPSLGTLRSLARPRRGGTLVAGAGDELAPSVDEEVAAVSRQLPNAITLAGHSATWAQIEPYLSNAAHVHLAGHALFRPDNPMYSALRVHDRWVTAGDVMSLDLRGTTVVLSACDTARTQYAGTAEINGFVRGLLGAGATTVVASQWTADDRATTEFMIDMYSHLGNHPPAAAVRLAQLAAAERRPHPYYWAPWVVVGRSEMASD